MSDAPQLTKIQMYCSALYDAMDRESVIVELGDGTKVKVWKGLITKTAESVGAGEGVYSRVVERLTLLGCITVLDKGRRNFQSTVALYYPPTAEVWAQEISPEDLTTKPTPARLQAELKSLKDRTGGIDVKLALKNLDDRLMVVETKLAKLELPH
jgi:hypothetical protein